MIYLSKSIRLMTLLWAFFLLSGPVFSQDLEARKGYEEALRILEEGLAEENLPLEIYSQMMEELSAALVVDPVNVETFLNMGRAAFNRSSMESSVVGREKRRQEAFDFFRQAITIAPERPEPHYELAIRLSDQDERLYHLERLVELVPDHPEGHGILARELLARDRIDEAVAAYRVHLTVAPYDGRPSGFQHIKFARALTATGRVLEAVEILRKVLELSSAERRFERCFLFQTVDLDPYEAFPETVAEIERLRPHCNALEHRNRAVELQHQGRLEEAALALERQLEINPLYEETYFLLTDLYHRLDQRQEALATMARFFAIESDQAQRCLAFRKWNLARVADFDLELTQQLAEACD